jgi:hypothetical protein
MESGNNLGKDTPGLVFLKGTTTSYPGLQRPLTSTLHYQVKSGESLNYLQ